MLLFSLRTKKYSRFVYLRLNTWSYVDYFTDVLATLLCLDRGSIRAILICVPKMNDGLTSLEQHEGE